MRIKSRQINFRVTEHEYKCLNKKCSDSGMNMSNFLLYSGLNKEIIIVNGLIEFTYKLRKIGINLNQLTKLCNENIIICLDLSETKEELSKIWQLLNLLTQKVV